MQWQTAGGARLDYQTYQYDAGNLKDLHIQTANGDWFEHFEYNGLNQPTEHQSKFYDSGWSVGKTLKWNQDSLGNRIDTNDPAAPRKYGNGQDAFKQNGSAKTIRLNRDNSAGQPFTHDSADITYDAWGRAQRINFKTDEGVRAEYILTYDALNRLAWSQYTPIRAPISQMASRQDIYSYTGNLELRHRIKPNGASESTFSESLWSPEGRMVGRLDTGQFIWTTTDVRGRTTALLQNSTLNVLERFVYDIDGMVKGTNASFALIDKTLDAYKWSQFAAGKQWINIHERLNNGLVGFYLSQEGLFDPENNSLTVANPAYTNQWRGYESDKKYDGVHNFLPVVGSLVNAGIAAYHGEWLNMGHYVGMAGLDVLLIGGPAIFKAGISAGINATIKSGMALRIASQAAITATERGAVMLGRGIVQVGRAFATEAKAFIQSWKLTPPLQIFGMNGGDLAASAIDSISRKITSAKALVAAAKAAGPLKEFEMMTYEMAKMRETIFGARGLGAHELIPNAWFEVNGIGGRLAHVASRENPVMMLSHGKGSLHGEITWMQMMEGYDSAYLQHLNVNDVIREQAQILLERGLPSKIVDALAERAYVHALKHGL